MKISIFYFSGTGNTWWITEKLKELFNKGGNPTETYSIERKDVDWEQLIPKLLSESDIIGIGYPVYGSSVPEIVKDWVRDHLFKSAKNHPKELKAFVYDTMAMFSGDTPLIMRKILKKCNFTIKQAINIRTLSNLPQMKSLMTWDKEKQAEIFEKAGLKCEKLVNAVLKNKKWVMRRDPFSRFVGWLQRVGMRWEGKTIRKLFTFDMDTCNLCGLCVKFCPVDTLSIEETEKKPIIKYGLDCIYCMRCFNNCPQDAVIVMKRTRDKEKYQRFRGQVPGFKLSKVRK